jgi:hypothetical protein
LPVLQVECYAGHRGEETPRLLVIDHRYFKIKGDDGDVYIIRQDTVTGTWELTMFRREG